MSYLNFTELETERLILSRLEESDWKEIMFLRSDKRVNQFVKRKPADTKAKSLKFIVNIQKGVANYSFYYWKIRLKSSRTMIGSVCLWNFSEDRKVAELGYDLMPEFQGKGIMSEAVEKVIQFGTQSLELKTIQAYTHGQNLPSIALLERHGFKLNRSLRDDSNSDNVVFELEVG